MSKFKVGDRVVITGLSYEGATGVVIKVEPHNNIVKIVRIPKGAYITVGSILGFSDFFLKKDKQQVVLDIIKDL